MDQIINIIKLISPFLGAIGLGGFITWYLQSKNEEKKQRVQIAKEILTAVYAYNVDAMNEWSIELESPKVSVDILRESKIRYMNAARRFNEAEALAYLFVNKEASELMEKLKTTVIEMFNELKNNLKDDLKRNRHEMSSGKKYDEHLRDLKEILDKWIDGSN